jgi:hypothetical protein
MASPWASHSRVEPSTSLKRKVTVPDGTRTPTATWSHTVPPAARMAAVCHVVVALIVVGILVWGGSTLLFDASG